MKVLFFADLHGDMEILSNLRKKADGADMIVCAGDISRMGSGIKKIMAEIDNFKKPVLMIHGNHEDPDELKELCDSSQNISFLHKAVHHFDDYVFMGYGGDGFSTNDPDFKKVADSFFRKEAEGKKRSILVTHGPPHGTELDRVYGEHTGNKTYRKFIEEFGPHLAISGHIHETAGKNQKIGKTMLLNPGKAGVIVDI